MKSNAKHDQDKQNRQDRDALRRCSPCRVCGVKPEWGAAFLVCPKCGQESEYNWYNGAAVRDWNKNNKL